MRAFIRGVRSSTVISCLVHGGVVVEVGGGWWWVVVVVEVVVVVVAGVAGGGGVARVDHCHLTPSYTCVRTIGGGVLPRRSLA